MDDVFFGFVIWVLPNLIVYGLAITVLRRRFQRAGHGRGKSRLLAVAVALLVSTALGAPYLLDRWTFVRQRAEVGGPRVLAPVPAADGIAIESGDDGCFGPCARLLVERAFSFVELVPPRGGRIKRFRLVTGHEDCAAARESFEAFESRPRDVPILWLDERVFEGALAYDHCVSRELADQPTTPLYLRPAYGLERELDRLYHSPATGGRIDLLVGEDPASRRLSARSESHAVAIPVVPLLFRLPVPQVSSDWMVVARATFGGPNERDLLDAALPLVKAEPATPIEAPLANLSGGPRMRGLAASVLRDRLAPPGASAARLDPAWAEPIVAAVDADPRLLRPLAGVLAAYGPAARGVAPAVAAAMGSDDPDLRGAAIQVALAAGLLGPNDIPRLLDGLRLSGPEDRASRAALEKLGVPIPAE